MEQNRRTMLTAAAAALAGAGAAHAEEKPVKKVLPKPKAAGEPPLFSRIVTFGNLVFLSGKGAHFEGDVRAHTKHVLDEIEADLESVGSSMDKVLKVNVYLNDIKDYNAMNETYRGRFGKEPPVRTTVAPAGGIPGNSHVEIEVIAYI